MSRSFKKRGVPKSLLPQEFFISKGTARQVEAITKMSLLLNKEHVAKSPTIFNRPTTAALRGWWRGGLKKATHRIWIAYVGERPIGYIAAYVIRRRKNLILRRLHLMYIHQIYVCRDFRSVGVGSELIDVVKQFAHAKRIDGLELDVWNHNESAHDFFRGNGFQDTYHRMSVGF